MKFSDLYIALGFRDDKFKRGLKGAQRRTSVFSKQIQRLGGLMSGVFAGTVLISFVSKLFKVNVQFEKTMSGVRAISGATNEEFQQLTDSARKLGEVTTKTAQEVGDLQIEFARIGFTTTEILNATEATIQLAEATGEDLAQSAQIAGATLRGFGKDAKQTNKVVDVMAKSFTSSALNLERWGESMKYVAPVSKAVGVSLEETAAMMSILADAGIHGSMAGTALRKMMLELTRDGRPLSESLKELAGRGITLADANDEVGQRAQTALLVLSRQTDVIKKLTTEYENASGAAEEMASIQTDNVQGALDRLGSAWTEQSLKMQKSNSIFKDFIDFITHNIKHIDNMARAVVAAATTSSIAWKLFPSEKIEEANKHVVEYQKNLEKANAKGKGIEAAWAAINKELNKTEEKTVRAREEIEDQELGYHNIKELVSAINDELDEYVKNLSKADNIKVRTEVFGFEDESDEDFNYDEELGEKLALQKEKVARFSNEVDAMIKQQLSETLVATGEMIGNLIAGDYDNMFNGILASFAGFLKEFGALLIAYGVAQLALKAGLINPLGAIAAGVALVAIGSLIQAKQSEIPQLADGGLIYGPSLVMAGEYSGANTNPEVFGKLSDIKGMLGGSGDLKADLEFTISGKNLKAVLKNESNNLSNAS